VGGKQTRRRKHVYLCVAVLILANLTACALNTVQVEQAEKDEARPDSAQTETLPEAGDYGAVSADKEAGVAPADKEAGVAPADKKPSADEILLAMGLKYADPANPGRDYARSTQYLRRLVKEHPASPLAGQARILIGLLQETEELRRTIDKLNGTVEKLNAIMEESKKVDVEIEEKRRERQR
jgi:hypothetical protein